MFRLPAVLLAALVLAGPARAADALTVQPTRVTDYKAVFATVQARDMTVARSRINGTVESLAIDEGDRVQEGAVLALVTDPKLPLQMAALDARIESARARRRLATTTLERVRELRGSGTVSQARLDEAQTTLETAQKELAALRAERSVTARRMEEGKVLAPTNGRVLDVKVTEGAVVMPGEVVARLATEQYFLRIRVPERHAASLGRGDTILVGGRGVAADADGPRRRGTITQVYPDVQNGRVVADVEVPMDLSGYLVGERTRVHVGTGTRQTFVVPRSYLSARYGVTFARLKDGTDVVVQPGRPADGGIEILSGLRPGDVLIQP